MIGTLRVTLLCALLCFSVGSYGQINLSLTPPKKRKVAEVVEPIHVSTTITHNKSQLEVVKKGGQKAFNLAIPEGYTLSNHYEVETDQFLVFAYQYDIFDGGGSQFIIIDKTDLSLVHRQVVGSFNIGAPLVHGDVLFIAAAGYVAEFEIASGHINWEKKNLFGRPHYFDGLLEGDSIEVNGDLVRFGPSFTVNRRTQQVVIEENGQ